ncbi:MAG: tRNA pseudouridine(55) synthase TruB [Candidatus Uhrbacteria bacterium]
MDNIVAINKPKGPTSHDIVNAVRRITGERRVGHAGTLDPMASGVLVIGIGRDATKQLAGIVAKEKEYIATITLGATSDTDDAEGTVTPTPSNSPSRWVGEKKIDSPNPSRWGGEGGWLPPTLQEVLPILQQFIGHIQQVPPKYSAIKIKGKPAHRRMRKGEDIQMEPREVEIKEIELLNYQLSTLNSQLILRVVCGPGTYIRSLARDIGEQLGVGGYLSALERTRVGQYIISDTLTVEELKKTQNRT